MKSALEHREATFLRGHRAEWIALLFLVMKGYRPLARRYAASGGEIDLIVMRGDTIAFVEVKARGLMDDALSAITARKLGLDMEKVILTVGQHGNTSGASIPLALDVGVRSGRIKRGQNLMLEGVGGGFTWGAVLVRY